MILTSITVSSVLITVTSVLIMNTFQKAVDEALL